MKTLYLKVPAGAAPKGIIAGYKKPDGKIHHVARLFPDRGVKVDDGDAKILMEKYPQRYRLWTKKAAEKVKEEMAAYEERKSERLQKQMGPLKQPKVVRQPNPELEGVDEEVFAKDEEISTDEMENPLQTTGVVISHAPPPDEMTPEEKEEAAEEYESEEKEEEKATNEKDPGKNDAMKKAVEKASTKDIPGDEAPPQDPPPTTKKTEKDKKNKK